MYDIRWIRDNAQAFDNGLKRRGLEPLSAKLLALDEKRRAAITKFEQAQARRNAASKEIGDAKKNKDEAKASALMDEVAKLKSDLPAFEAEQNAIAAELHKELAQIPNMPSADVPNGADEKGNVEHHVWGKKRDYAFKPKQHFELGEALGMMDFELAAKLSGARFVILQKGLARLERALGQLFLDTHTGEKHAYTEVSPPLMVRDDAMFGTAQLPKFKNDQFSSISLNLFEKESLEEVANVASANTMLSFLHSNFLPTSTLSDFEKYYLKLPASPNIYQSYWNDFQSFDLWPHGGELRKFLLDYGHLFANAAVAKTEQERFWLIPTAEVPLTNMVRESIIDEDKLPMRLTACTPCFRAEAGAAGKDTRGMIRQHQFTKVELVSITTPEQSRAEHERMLACAEEVLKKLDLHYRVVTLCTGDMGFAAQKTYDIEVWLPGQDMFREISSCSNCGSFQALRMNARYKGKDGKVKGPVHTLNGSGVAVGRALIAVMETYQQADGSIVVPDALAPYMGGLKVVTKQ